MDKKNIFFVMGVSGCGKSTVGKLLAEKLDCPFFDGDDYHLEAHVQKMAAGNPLNDEDRKGWLQSLNRLAAQHKDRGAIITCSALKKAYRDTLTLNLDRCTAFVYLEGTFDEILARLQVRKDHFMPPDLLRSQFETLEPPQDAIGVSINKTPEEIVGRILEMIGRA